MEYIPVEPEVNDIGEGFVLDIGSLYDYLSRIKDYRDARGVRYKLVDILVLIVLAKLAGEDRLSGTSEWVCHRREGICRALGLGRVQAPHRTTYSRVLSKAVSVLEVERSVRDFFTTSNESGQWVQVAIDGKTLRGSIGAGRRRGVHLLAAYLPEEGYVLAQVEVDGKENEISAAPRLLDAIDLRGKVITADAMLTQRQLSAQIVESGGEYVWNVKDNQPQLRDDIATLFEDGGSHTDGLGPTIARAETIDKGHGRLERRVLRASSDLNDYLDWPYARQVFELDRRVKRLRDGRITRQLSYGITSLDKCRASPGKLLEIVRTHWQIENGLHYRRDETLREDWCHLDGHHAQHMMATINNLTLGLMLRIGVRNVPRQRRLYAAHWDSALKLITSA